MASWLSGLLFGRFGSRRGDLLVEGLLECGLELAVLEPLGGFVWLSVGPCLEGFGEGLEALLWVADGIGPFCGGAGLVGGDALGEADDGVVALWSGGLGAEPLGGGYGIVGAPLAHDGLGVVGEVEGVFRA